MAKDYAKRVFTTSRNRKKKWLRKEFIIIPLLVLVCSVGFGTFKLRNSLLFADNSLLAQAKLHFSHSKTAKLTQLTKNKPISQDRVAPTVHFDFYNELPQVKVTLPEKDNMVAPKRPNPIAEIVKKDLVYMIQFGQFNDEIGAGQLRLSLLLSGIEAEVVKAHSQSGNVFKVQSGPFIDQAEAKNLQNQYQKKGISAVVKKA